METTNQASTNQEVTNSEGTIKITAFYRLSEAGQRESLKAGGTGVALQKVAGEIRPAQLEFCRIKPDGKALLFVLKTNFYSGDKESDELKRAAGVENLAFDRRWFEADKQFFDAPQTVASLVEFIERGERERAEYATRVESAAGAFFADESLRLKVDYSGDVAMNYGGEEFKFGAQSAVAKENQRRFDLDLNAQLEEAAAAFLADPSQRPTSYETYNNRVLVGGLKFVSPHPVYTAAVERRQADQADEQAAAAEREREETRRAEEKVAFISGWVEAHGTVDQRERLAAGLLPSDEIVKAIEAATFAGLDEKFKFERYEKITTADVRRECDAQCACADSYEQCEVEFDVEPAISADADEWERLKLIRLAAPDAEVTLRRHNGTCQDNDCETGGLNRAGIYVKQVVGPFTFNAEYAA